MTQPRWFTWGPPRPQFVYPAGVLPRVAVVHETLRVDRPGKTFHPQSGDLIERLVQFQPDALACRYEFMSRIAHEFGVRKLSVRNALIIFRESGEAAIADSQRDDLWRAFEVPVFEQIISAEGELIAYECEAHSGLHLGTTQPILGAALMNTATCECGAKAPRMVAVPAKPKVKYAAA
jgi:hypothetical protein